jgi:hypothetical protein
MFSFFESRRLGEKANHEELVLGHYQTDDERRLRQAVAVAAEVLEGVLLQKCDRNAAGDNSKKFFKSTRSS